MHSGFVTAGGHNLEYQLIPAHQINRPTLVREIQRELKRIGCYRGDVHGVWTTSVREAMKAFTEATGRPYSLIESYKMDDAEFAIVGMGCSVFGERWEVGADGLMVEALP